MKSIFITLEGGEGCGKSTHAKLLKKHLLRNGYKVVLTFEPGGTVPGRKLRKLLLNGAKFRSRYAELFLFGADRAEHIARVIKPSLASNKIVISDRFTDSTTAYQEGGRRLSKSLIGIVNNISSDGLVPDLTLLLDIPPDVGIDRGTRHSKKDKFERENMGFHDRVRKAYLSIAKKEPKRVKVISSLHPVGIVQDMIRKYVDEKLRNKR